MRWATSWVNSRHSWKSLSLRRTTHPVLTTMNGWKKYPISSTFPEGEVTKTVRVVMANVADIRTYVYGITYNSWNRVQTITYGSVLMVKLITTILPNRWRALRVINRDVKAVIVHRIGVTTKDGHKVYTKLGNVTETTYTYGKQRERLQAMNLTADGQEQVSLWCRGQYPRYYECRQPNVADKTQQGEVRRKEFAYVWIWWTKPPCPRKR